MHRASSNQLKTKRAITDLYNDVLKPVDSMLYRRGNNDVRVIVDCQPPNLLVNTDQLRLKQIILNLGRNSQKFVTQGFIRLSARVVEGFVQLSVEDSGPGIPLSKREQLFEKFQSSLDSLSQGTGIGLYLCKQLTELLGGQIWLDANYQSGIENCPGTRFVIDLNARAEREENDDDLELPALERNADSCSLPPKLNVLLVDDDTMVRKLFSRAVKRVAPGWTVSEASNGETALKLTLQERRQYDIMFMDQYMASVEKQLLGTETVRELRAAGFADCIICGCSANDLRDQFFEAGADSFLIKPFPCKEEELREELKKILSSRSCR